MFHSHSSLSTVNHITVIYKSILVHHRTEILSLSFQFVVTVALSPHPKWMKYCISMFQPVTFR